VKAVTGRTGLPINLFAISQVVGSFDLGISSSADAERAHFSYNE